MKKAFVIIALMGCSCSFALAAQPVVAIHVSELTQALETKAAVSPTPMGQGTTGFQWWTPWWHYFVSSDSLKEALRSDGTPFTVVSDADIRAGNLLGPDGSPKYPIVISLGSEAISNDEIAPLLSYVSRGGFLLVGSSSFTRNPDGSPRGDFAIANAMGLHNASPSLDNWYQASTFTAASSHRLISHIPSGTLRWRMPLTSDDVSWGTSPSHGMEGSHYAWQVIASNATVIANGDQGPYLTVTPYGSGTMIYYSAMQPLLGFGGLAPSMYSYGIFRNAIEWAFESENLPIIRLSPWPYLYNSAYMVRHDFENYQDAITNIEASAQAEAAVGAKGEYYFCTGTLRLEMNNSPTVVDSLRRAVSLYGASIGPHNGGLPNPNNQPLALGDYDYWHWGPDEALDSQVQGYGSGAAYASASLAQSFQDIDSWLSGLNANGNLKIWVSPYFNATREGSMQLLDGLGVNTSGEQKLSPFPHWTISTETQGKKYRFLSLPTSEWFINGDVAQAIETTHTKTSIDALVDFYYGFGSLVNLYSHESSTAPEPAEYLRYASSKPAIWAVNAPTLFNWWTERSGVQFTPSYSIVGNRFVAAIPLNSAVASDMALDIAIPNWDVAATGLQVKLDGVLVGPGSYRVYKQGIKVSLGSGVTNVEVSYPLTSGPIASNDLYTGNAGSTLSIQGPGVLANDSSPSGTPLNASLVSPPTNGVLNLSVDGSFTYEPATGFSGLDHFSYIASDGVNQSSVATVTLVVNAAGTLFSDAFSWPSGSDPFWVTVSGSWNVVNDTMLGSSTDYSYGYTYAKGSWSDYSVQAQIKFPGGAYGGGIGGRVNVANGAHYGAWIYPEGSPGGSAVLKLVKFSNWQTWSGTPMAQASLPGVGTSWHTIALTFQGNRIRVSFDGTQYIDVSDSGFDSSPAYTTGAISLDLWSENLPSSMTVGNVSVQVLSPTAQSDGYTMTQGSTLDIAAPGVLGNDTATAGAGLTAALVSPAANGALTLQANGAFTYTPVPGYTGIDSFTYQTSSAGMLSNVGTVLIMVNPAGILFSDDFSLQPGPDPWFTTVYGSWAVASGSMQGSSASQTYGFAYVNGNWTDYSVQARLQFPAGAFGGGIGGRLNPTSGAHYGAWIYPEGSGGGSSVLKLVKFHDWTSWSRTPMAQVNLPAVGTSWHTLLLNFQGNVIQVSYDGVQYISVTDDAFDALPAYTSGGVGLDMWTEAQSYTMNVDDVLVQAITAGPIAQNDNYAIPQEATLTVSAPGVLANDSGAGTGANAVIVAQPANGTLALQSNGGFTYVPSPGFVGTDTFSYYTDVRGQVSNTATVSILVTSNLASLNLSPASVTGGSSSTATVTLGGPAPSGGAIVAVTNSNPAIVSVPSTVTIAENATSASFSVATIAVGNNSSSSISATYNGNTQTAILSVAPPEVSSIVFNPSSLLGGSASTGTITLNAPAPPGGALITLTSSNGSAITIPPSITIAANSSTATFPVTSIPVSADTSVSVSATYGASSQRGSLTVMAASLNTLSLNPSSVLGGTSSTGTLSLNGPAPSGGAVILLSTNNAAVALPPATVTIASGATSATFTIRSFPVAVDTVATVSAQYGTAVQAVNLTVIAATLASGSLSPSSVRGGTTATGTVALNGPAPAGGALVGLASSNPSIAYAPASIAIAAGSTSVSFTITTFPVATNASVVISAAYNGASRTASLTVLAPTFSGFSLSPSSVLGGGTSTGTVTLNGPAPASGVTVALRSSNTTMATVPVSATVPANATSVTFLVTTFPVASNSSVTISGTSGTTTRSATLNITAATLSAISLNPTSVHGGNTSTGTLTLNGPAPASGSVVTLSSSNTLLARVPSRVTIPSGRTTVSFTVSTSPVTSTRSVVIYGTRGVTRGAALALTP